MLEKLLELDDILLYPEQLNSGYINQSKYNFGVFDEVDHGTYLPIFTTDVDSVINRDNWNEFSKNGIRPVLPQTEDLQIRLEGCQYIFASFTIPEVKINFINNRRNSNNVLRISIVNDGNGHDTEILNTAVELRKIYGDQVNIMAGNIANPKTYIEYCKARIDYVRVGISTGSLINQNNTGFYYPMASLLLDILGMQKTSCAGLKLTKIIADGGISDHIDILKAIALGADYVMIGRQFAGLVEAAGAVYRKERGNPNAKNEEISKETLTGVPVADLKSMELKRLYFGTNRESTKSDWIRVTSNLNQWLKELYAVFNNGYLLSNSSNWKEYKTHIKICRIQ